LIHLPYYIYCSKCNPSGRYERIDKKCSKCQGTGNDWREDHKLESFHKRFDVSLKQLKKEKIITTTTSGTKIFYSDTIPSIEEERKLVKSFRSEKNNEEEKEKIAKKDFEVRVKFIKDFFHKNDDQTFLYDNKNNKAIIDNATLAITYDGFNNKLANNLNAILKQLEKSTVTDNINLNEIIPTEELIQKYPEVLKLLETQEMYSHELFHLLQFSFYQVSNNTHKIYRKIYALRAILLSELIRTDTEIYLQNQKEEYENQSIFDFVLDIKDESVQNFFLNAIKEQREEPSIVNNFFTYKYSGTNFNMIDIFEGSAIAFQKLANRTDNVKTIYDVEENSPAYKKYYGAWDYYKEKGGYQRVVFFLLTHQALKYGFLDNDYLNVVPTPQVIFENLCKNAGIYEKNYFEKLNSNTLPFRIDNEIKKLHLEHNQLVTVYALAGLLEEIKQDIRDFSRQTNTYDDYAGYDEIFERKVEYTDNIFSSNIKAISSQIEKDYPIFKTQYFLPVLIVNYSFYSNFMFAYLPKMLKNITYKSIFGTETNIDNEKELFRLVSEIDDFINKKVTYCCQNHRGTNVNWQNILNCNSNDSLKNRFRNFTGKEIFDFISFV
jgi:hypothetical protein